MDKPTGFTEQSCEGRAGPAEGRRGAGEGRAGQGWAGWARAPRDGWRRGGCGRLPLPALLRARLSFSLFYSGRSVLPEVNSTMKASSSPVNGSCERITTPRGSRRRRHHRRRRRCRRRHRHSWRPARRAAGAGRALRLCGHLQQEEATSWLLRCLRTPAVRAEISEDCCRSG